MSFRIASLAFGQLHGCPDVLEVTMKEMNNIDW